MEIIHGKMNIILFYDDVVAKVIYRNSGDEETSTITVDEYHKVADDVYLYRTLYIDVAKMQSKNIATLVDMVRQVPVKVDSGVLVDSRERFFFLTGVYAGISKERALHTVSMDYSGYVITARTDRENRVVGYVHYRTVENYTTTYNEFNRLQCAYRVYLESWGNNVKDYYYHTHLLKETNHNFGVFFRKDSIQFPV